ncbi:MAG: PVC-type heme-binding CxxCH protein [Planctomycetia bacterium]|nr:PVC-type heme-binding CxxCH protein [Planctomycetia bacterium]
MQIARSLAFSAIFAALPAQLARADEPAAGSRAWIKLFDGKSLDGWYTYLHGIGRNKDPQRVFQVEGGAIHVYKDHAAGSKAPKGYVASDVEYANYHLRFQYKWGDKRFAPRNDKPRDAGLLFHVVGPDRVWPRSVECQVQEQDTGDCFTVMGTQIETTVAPDSIKSADPRYLEASAGGVPCTRGGPKTVRTIKGGTHENDGWNTVEVIVRSGEGAVHIVNGKINFRSTNLRQLGADGKSWQPLTHGRIALQAEFAEVYYRNIEIRPIEDRPLQAAIVPPAVHVPAGFEVTQVAGPPQVEYPTLACLDDQGRLYVSEGAAVNDPYDVLTKTLPRSIRRLEDTNGDGVYDRSTVFADKMTFPYGGVWHDGALYVASDPTLWRLEDTDGDGIADKRDAVISGFGSEGHSSCMKGAYLAPDGWLYFCGGNEGGGYDLKGADGKSLKDTRTAPCVFRIRPDGRDLEVVANGAAGVYDLCFDTSGDIFGIVTILKYPRGDGLMHWTYGGSYETSRPRSRYARFTGDRLPPLKEWPQTSPSGAMRYESGAFGEEYRGNIFTAHFNTHVVTRNAITRDGGAWKVTQEETFVRSESTNCRFTDVLEDADGSLLVVNTGGWFRIGCPTSQVAEGPLTGAIYRVRKVGQHRQDDPRGANIAWKDASNDALVALLGDARFTVRDKAISELARRGKAATPALRQALQDKSPDVRPNAVWALTRIDDVAARAAVREAFGDSDSNVSLAALHGAGLWRDADASDRMLALLKSDQPAVRRNAATGLGRLENASAAPALLDALSTRPDRIVEHAIIYALIEIDSPIATRAGLKHADHNVARGALIALDQMPHGDLTQIDVEPLLTRDDAALQNAAIDVCARHKGWSKGVVNLLARWLGDSQLSTDRRASLAVSLRSFRGDRNVQQLIGASLASAKTSDGTRRLLLDTVAGSAFSKVPSAWNEPLLGCLQSSDDKLARRAVASIAANQWRAFDAPLQSLALDASRAMPVRLAAATFVATNRSAPDDRVLDLLVAQCTAAETDPVTRLMAARVLGDAQLTPAQLERMAPRLAAAGPLELPGLLRRYEDVEQPVAGEELCSALLKSPGIDSLSTIRLERLLRRYPQTIQDRAASLLNAHGHDSQAMAARLDELKLTLEGGDAARGREVFQGKAACSQCHRVEKRGNTVGPDLSQIGETRTRRELLEAVAFPSATFARGYEPVTLVTSAGLAMSGIIRRETADDVYLMTADRSEAPIRRDEIEEIEPSRVSIMPQGLDRTMTPDELRDLLAFLTSLKAGQ